MTQDDRFLNRLRPMGPNECPNCFGQRHWPHQCPNTPAKRRARAKAINAAIRKARRKQRAIGEAGMQGGKDG